MDKSHLTEKLSIYKDFEYFEIAVMMLLYYSTQLSVRLYVFKNSKDQTITIIIKNIC